MAIRPCDLRLVSRESQFQIRPTCTTDQYFTFLATLYTGSSPGLYRRGTNLCLSFLFATFAFAICALQVSAQSSQIEEKRPVKRIVQPVIPEFAMKLNLTGSVKIEVTIAPDGTVKTTRIIGGHPVLAAATKAPRRKVHSSRARERTVEVIEFKFSGK